MIKKKLTEVAHFFVRSPKGYRVLQDIFYSLPGNRMRDIDKRKYKKDKKEYISKNLRAEFLVDKKYEFPILDEWRQQAGGANLYFWQDLWAAMRIAERMPKKHFDIGSRIDGFISHLMLLKIPVTLIDIRPLDQKMKGVNFLQADATELAGVEDGSIESLSALCSLEHFGLGRYGDPVDPEACFKAFKAVQRVVKPGGFIYISVPVGKERLCFNAHRVFEPATIVREFGQCVLKEYSVADMTKNPVLVENCPLDQYNDQEVAWMGMFVFQKKAVEENK